MAASSPSSSAFRVAGLDGRDEHTFDLRPDQNAREALAAQFDLIGLRKLVFTGALYAEGDGDWRLQADLGATVVQPCGITLEPVTTRIDTRVTRLFQKDFLDLTAPECEMPEDENVEPLGRFIDPQRVMEEALALALPAYPRKDDAALGQMVHTEPGKSPMRDEDARPFAGLAALKGQLGSSDEPTGES